MYSYHSIGIQILFFMYLHINGAPRVEMMLFASNFAVVKSNVPLLGFLMILQPTVRRVR